MTNNNISGSSNSLIPTDNTKNDNLIITGAATIGGGTAIAAATSSVALAVLLLNPFTAPVNAIVVASLVGAAAIVAISTAVIGLTLLGIGLYRDHKERAALETKLLQQQSSSNNPLPAPTSTATTSESAASAAPTSEAHATPPPPPPPPPITLTAHEKAELSRKKIEYLEQEKEKLSAENMILQVQVTQLQTEVESKKTTIKSLTEEHNDRDDIDCIMTLLSKYTSVSNEDLITQEKGLRSEIEHIKQLLKKIESVKALFDSQIKQNKEYNYNGVTHTIRTMQGAIQQMNGEIRKQNDLSISKENELKKIVFAKAVLQKETDRQTISNAISLINTHKQKLTELEESVKTLNGKISDKEQELEKLKRQSKTSYLAKSKAQEKPQNNPAMVEQLKAGKKLKTFNFQELLTNINPEDLNVARNETSNLNASIVNKFLGARGLN